MSVALVCEFIHATMFWNRQYTAKSRPLFFIVIAAMFPTVAFQRNVVWGGRAAIWLDAAQKSPRKARPHVNVGLFYDMAGDLDNAQYEYKIAIQLEPDYLAPYSPLAVIYGEKGDIVIRLLI